MYITAAAAAGCRHHLPVAAFLAIRMMNLKSYIPTHLLASVPASSYAHRQHHHPLHQQLLQTSLPIIYSDIYCSRRAQTGLTPSTNPCHLTCCWCMLRHVILLQQLPTIRPLPLMATYMMPIQHIIISSSIIYLQEHHHHHHSAASCGAYVPKPPISAASEFDGCLPVIPAPEQALMVGRAGQAGRDSAKVHQAADIEAVASTEKKRTKKHRPDNDISPMRARV